MPIPGLFPPPLPCPADATAAALALDTSAALSVYVGPNMDLPAFYSRAAAAQSRLPCVKEPLSGPAVAELMEVLAVLSFAQKDDAGAEALLRAARRAQPGASLPEAVRADVPRLNAIQTRANTAPLSAGAPLPPVAGARWLINGGASTTVPAGEPYVLQVIWESDGKVHWTGLLPAGASPDLAAMPTLLPPPPPPTCPSAPSCDSCCPEVKVPSPALPEPPPAWLVVSALGSTALAGGLYGWAVHTDNVFWSPDTPDGDLEGLLARSQRLQWSALGVGVVGLGLDVTLGIQLSRPYRAPSAAEE